MASLTKLTYRVWIGICLTTTLLHPRTFLVDTGAWPDQINEHCLKPYWKCRIEPLKSLKLRTATQEGINTQEVVPLFLKKETSRFRHFWNCLRPVSEFPTCNNVCRQMHSRNTHQGTRYSTWTPSSSCYVSGAGTEVKVTSILSHNSLPEKAEREHNDSSAKAHFFWS